MNRATKTQRQVITLGSLALGIGTIIILATDVPDCANTNLTFAMYLIFFNYAGIFILFLLQVAGCVSLLKNNPKILFLFYGIISGTMFLVQMFLFQAKNCFAQTPIMYSWLVAQVSLFYLIVAYGLAYWGSYICYQQTIKEEQTRQIVEEYIKENFPPEKTEPLLLKNDEESNSNSGSDSDSDRRKKSKKGKKKKKKRTLAITNIDDDLD